jgi:hypothetical protein
VVCNLKGASSCWTRKTVASMEAMVGGGSNELSREEERVAIAVLSTGGGSSSEFAGGKFISAALAVLVARGDLVMGVSRPSQAGAGAAAACGAGPLATGAFPPAPPLAASAFPPASFLAPGAPLESKRPRRTGERVDPKPRGLSSRPPPFA